MDGWVTVSVVGRDINLIKMKKEKHFNLVPDASCSLFFFDYTLTVYKEAAFFWWPGRVTLSTVSFLIARLYGGIACVAVSLLPAKSAMLDSHYSLLIDCSVLRLVTIVSSEFIVAVRTWAIWGKNRRILFILSGFTLAALIPAAVIIGLGITTNRIQPLISQELIDICNVTIGDMQQAFVIPYILTILYEAVTLTLSLIRIMKWRKGIPETMRAPLLDTLWRDGVMYFSFMLVLGFMNIGIVLQSGAPQLRNGAADLQAVLHSMMSTRIVLHLADSQVPRDITNPSCSVYNTESGVEFTTQMSLDGSERLPIPRTTHSMDEAIHEEIR
ncbi:hypothetical protein VNI00_010102 [Paramarasmius palmivorus]|uniref:Uncharacterized protein n=1 Tax=Paramarasmius palmivorus TaxID=297713 RepID=A0AAW0CL51_9AGAR